MDVVRKIERTKKGRNDKPDQPIIIENCGELDVDAPFTVPMAPVA